MKKVKYPNLDDYDLSDYVELKGDILYKINGGAQVENSNEGVANAQVGDTITRNDGTTVTLNAGDIKYAQNQIGSSGGGASNGAGNVASDGTATTSAENVASASGSTNVNGSPSNTSPSSSGNAGTDSSSKNSSSTSSLVSNTPSLKDVQIVPENGGKTQPIDTIVKGCSTIAGVGKKIKWEAMVAKYPDGWAAGTPFNSIEEAAQAWAITYADDSISLNSELSSTIYSYVDKSGRTKYSYNIPKQGDRKTCDPNSNLSEGQTAVSVIHSHGSYFYWHEDDSPSSDDMELAGVRTEYVVTPFGNMYSYNKDGVIETVRKNLPRDPFVDDYRTASYVEFNRRYLHPDPYIDYYTNRVTIYEGEHK